MKGKCSRSWPLSDRSSPLHGIKAAPFQFRKVPSPLSPLGSPIQERGGFKTTFIHTACSCDKLDVPVNPTPAPAGFMSLQPNSAQASPQLKNLQWLPTACRSSHRSLPSSAYPVPASLSAGVPSPTGLPGTPDSDLLTHGGPGHCLSLAGFSSP